MDFRDHYRKLGGVSEDFLGRQLRAHDLRWDRAACAVCDTLQPMQGSPRRTCSLFCHVPIKPRTTACATWDGTGNLATTCETLRTARDRGA